MMELKYPVNEPNIKRMIRISVLIERLKRYAEVYPKALIALDEMGFCLNAYKVPEYRKNAEFQAQIVLDDQPEW
jgi:hypothetical protein